MTTAEIGVIGGSGFYALDELRDAERIDVETPFGAPSGPIVAGTLEGRRIAFIARHGEGYRLLPPRCRARQHPRAQAARRGARDLALRRRLAAGADRAAPTP